MRVSLLDPESHLADEEKNFEVVNVDFHMRCVPSFVQAKHQRARVVPILVALSIVTLPEPT